jgi:hypothetical protein
MPILSLTAAAASSTLLLGAAMGAIPGAPTSAASAAPRDATATYELIPLEESLTFPAQSDISRNGRFAAITARDPLDHRQSQVAVWDRRTAQLTPVSVTPSGQLGQGRSVVADISLDGRYVLFTSWAADLVPDDTNSAADAFLRDRRTSITQRVSLSATGEQLSERSTANALTADDRVVFFSTASQAASDDRNDDSDVYARDLITGQVQLVSRNSDGQPANGRSYSAQVSDDGRWVAFLSYATNLAPDDPRTDRDVYLRNRKTGHTRLVSAKRTRGLTSWSARDLGGISGDGRVVVFDGFGNTQSSGGSLLPFVYQRQTGKLRNVLGLDSLGKYYGQGHVNSLNGNRVTISTNAPLTQDHSRPSGENVYLLRLSDWTFSLLTPTDSRGYRVGTDPWSQVLSRDGHVLFFETDRNYTSTDTDQQWDAYLRDIPWRRTGID